MKAIFIALSSALAAVSATASSIVETAEVPAAA
jgi:hypothetical protein